MTVTPFLLALPLMTPGADEAQPEPGPRWHADYEAALAAARESGKPVLLFQLMGRLDEEFC